MQLYQIKIYQLLWVCLSVGLVLSCKDKQESPLVITNLSTEVAAPGEELVILGAGFGSGSQVLFGTEEATAQPAEVLEATANRLTVIVPETVPRGKVRVYVRQGTTTVRSNLFLSIADIVLQGDISQDLTLKGNRSYLLKGIVAVKAPVSLTIEPGTIIKGDKESKSVLVIEAGARILAEGSPTQPIVFTSSRAAGPVGRDFADWGGLIIMGKAPVGQEGTSELGALPGKLSFGGNNPEDNSGVLKYVRIEFAGQPVLDDIPLAGLTLAGVGKGTILENIQVSYCQSDGIGWIGGRVNSKYLVAYSCKEDDFDVSQGYEGHLQFVLGVKDPFISSRNGFSDGFEISNSRLQLANYSFLGGMALLRNASINGRLFIELDREGNQIGSEVVSERHGMGVYLTENAQLGLYNSAIIGTYLAGLGLDKSCRDEYENQLTDIRGNAILGPKGTSLPGGSSFAQQFGVVGGANALGEIFFLNHFLEGNGPEPDAVAVALKEKFDIDNSTSLGPNDLAVPDIREILDNIFTPWGIIDFCNSVLFTNGEPRLVPLEGRLRRGTANVELPSNEYFEKVPFKGAFGDTDWTTRWAAFNPKIIQY